MKETQEELSLKTTECRTQQEEITNLFSQIFELQARIKTLSQNNNEMKSNYETTTSELLVELADLKQKYNECLKQLNKTQDELSSLRKKSTPSGAMQNRQTSMTGLTRQMSKSTNTNNNNNNCSQLMTSCEFDDSSLSCHEPVEYVRGNSNSLATELFCSLARDYRAKNL